MTRLFLIKHSMPQIDPSRPALEWRLSEDGRNRCAWLAGQLAGQGLDAIVSSHERKAIETATLVGEALNIRPTVQDGLQENDRSAFPFIEDKTEWEQRFVEFFESAEEQVIGNESAAAALARFDAAVHTALEGAVGNVAIVAHGTVISLFVSRYNRVDPFAMWKSLNPLPAFIELDVPGFNQDRPPVVFS